MENSSRLNIHVLMCTNRTGLSTLAMPRIFQHQSPWRAPALVPHSLISGQVPIENESGSLQIALVNAYQESDFAISALTGTLTVSFVVILGGCTGLN